MPDVNPAALNRSDPVSQPVLNPLITTKINGTNLLLSQKVAKPTTTVQRIDLEPLYTNLKAAVGDHWVIYKEAISTFVIGDLNQKELSHRINHFICSDTSTEHLHNQFLSGIYGNIGRDSPEQGVAPWVSANDKPTAVSKPVSGDAAEQRLKQEVMRLPPRDRRRLKELRDVCVGGFQEDVNQHDTSWKSHKAEYVERLDPYLNMLNSYHLATCPRPPADSIPSSAGLNKTNYDLALRKRYTLPLASETGEFPDAPTIHSRLLPIAHSLSLPDGAHPSCADLLTVATETYIKEFLSAVFVRTRSNLASGNGITTRRFRRQLEREILACERGEVVRGKEGLLPCEVEERKRIGALGMGDLRLSLRMGNCGVGMVPGVMEKVLGGWKEGELEGWGGWEGKVKREEAEGMGGGADEVGIDEQDWGWDGATDRDRDALGSVLDECLAFGQ